MIRQSVAIFKVNQEIDIAIRMHLPARYRAKHRNLTRAVLASQRHNLRTQAPDVF